MVRLDRIITRGGDGGETSLGDGRRVRKDDARIDAYGTVDEANAVLGLLRRVTANGPPGSDLAAADAMLARIQNDLFDLGADLCVPQAKGETGGGAARGRLRVQAEQVARLEAETAMMNETLPPLRSFVLPGGSAASAWAHLARTTVRRAERAAVTLATAEAEGAAPLNPEILRYLNRLSDHLFVLGRWLNGRGAQDVAWVPGATRGS
ncbi:MAG: cob(I)yrinic acid a,c-diamide adenosyltransferase [Alphaproteobacteria bacterium]|nr:cob(I)yrinic acid a,c-diamide adenosyltransferase [Alphaproteobacteria bacterium]